MKLGFVAAAAFALVKQFVKATIRINNVRFMDGSIWKWKMYLVDGLANCNLSGHPPPSVWCVSATLSRYVAVPFRHICLD